MRIVIATSGIPFDGSSLTTGSLGGSETAVLCVARELAALGHEVKVFCNCGQRNIFDGVFYFPLQEFQSHCLYSPCDVLIASRWPELLAYKVPAGLRVLWCHDILVSPETILGGLFQTDMLMLLSDYHIEQYCTLAPKLRPHIWKTSNGVDLDAVDRGIRPKVRKKLIYTSRPERGLLYMLEEVLPKILEKHPDAKLYCATYRNPLIKADDPVSGIIRDCEEAAKQYPANVILMGHLTKDQLYSQMSSAEVWVYPTQFPEISCISAMEAQACGTAVVTTDGFALSETVGPFSGARVFGLPSTDGFAENFAAEVNRLLDDPKEAVKCGKQGRAWVNSQGYTWSAVAKSWVEKFEAVLHGRWHEKSAQIVKELERTNDLVPALELAKDAGLDASRIEKKIAIVQNARAEALLLQPERYAASIPRFRTLVSLVRAMGRKPKTILDFRANDVAFGLVAAKEFPESAVTIYVRDEEARSRVKEFVKKSGCQNVSVVDSVRPDEAFDLVVADEQIDLAVKPEQFLHGLMAYLLPKGLVAFTSRFGGVSGTADRAQFQRLWNLDAADFQRMFPEDAEYASQFCSSGIGDGGDLLGHWCVTVARTRKLTGPDVEGRKLRTRPYQSLAVCMIVKNEEDWLTGCLKSVLPVADRIVVADTGSTDTSKQIARMFDAELREIAFDNFAQARNASIENLTEDWILWIDADERLLGADNLRKYLQGAIFEGFVIRQHHLMLDLQNTHDVPIRLLRNRPEYRFTGCIHEHCEDISENPYDDPITPALLLPDVNIVHYGYVNERLRRAKTSNRNMELLIRDVKENATKGRLLTWVCVIRDYMNIVKWHMERGGEILEGSFYHECLNAVVATYLSFFGGNEHRLKEAAYPIYQDALKLMGLCQLRYPGMELPPFEVGLTLTGAHGGLQNRDVPMKAVWFLCPDEYRLYVESKAAELEASLTGKDVPPFRFTLGDPVPDPIPILRRGQHLFVRRVH